MYMVHHGRAEIVAVCRDHTLTEWMSNKDPSIRISGHAYACALSSISSVTTRSSGKFESKCSDRSSTATIKDKETHSPVQYLRGDAMP